jgi:drug/metabolite transporter (DMT)-like permease
VENIPYRVGSQSLEVTVVPVVAPLHSIPIKMGVSEAIHVRLPLFYVFLSGLGFSVQSLMIKLSAEHGFQGSFQCVFLRGIVQFLLSSYFIHYDEDRRAGNGPRLFGNTNWVRFMLFMRSLTGFGGISFGFLAVELIPLGDAVVLIMLSPLIASVIGYFMLGEPWRLPELCGTISALVGAVMVAKPAFLFGGSGHQDATFYRGVAYALTSACCAAMTFICVRILGTTAKMPWANVVFSQAVGQIILAIPGLYIVGQELSLNISPYVASLLLVGGCVGAWSQILMTIGMQREKSAAATAMRMSDVAFGFIWQVRACYSQCSNLACVAVGGTYLCAVLPSVPAH